MSEKLAYKSLVKTIVDSLDSYMSKEQDALKINAATIIRREILHIEKNRDRHGNFSE